MYKAMLCRKRFEQAKLLMKFIFKFINFSHMLKFYGLSMELIKIYFDSCLTISFVFSKNNVLTYVSLATAFVFTAVLS